MKKVLHTYHETLPQLAEYYDGARLLELWRRSWARFGWRTVVLSRGDAERHPKWPDYAAAVSKFPTTNLKGYEAANYHRWMAMAVVGGGFMSDADVLPLADWRPETHPGFTIYSVDHLEQDGICPCFVHGDAAQYDAICDHFAAAGAWAGSYRHVSDQELLRARRIPFNIRHDVLTYDDPRIAAVGKAAHFKNDAIRSESGTKSERVARLYARFAV
jgi:hypothetical protein